MGESDKVHHQGNTVLLIAVALNQLLLQLSCCVVVFVDSVKYSKRNPRTNPINVNCYLT